MCVCYREHITPLLSYCNCKVWVGKHHFLWSYALDAIWNLNSQLELLRWWCASAGFFWVLYWPTYVVFAQNITFLGFGCIFKKIYVIHIYRALPGYACITTDIRSHCSWLWTIMWLLRIEFRISEPSLQPRDAYSLVASCVHATVLFVVFCGIQD